MNRTSAALPSIAAIAVSVGANAVEITVVGAALRRRAVRDASKA